MINTYVKQGWTPKESYVLKVNKLGIRKILLLEET